MTTRPRKYTEGQQWGPNTIVEYPYASKKVLLRCECGRERWVSLKNMKQVLTQKCRYCNAVKPEVKTYRMVRDRAKARGLEFDLSYEDWLEYSQEPCFYCAGPPSNNSFGFMYNGIDRVANVKGYLPGNCLPCCKVCNRAKSNMTLKEWDEWIRRLGSRNGEYFTVYRLVPDDSR